MSPYRALCFLCLSLCPPVALPAPSPPDDEVPPTARVDIVRDTYFGVTVPDPYRWMEAGGAEFERHLRAQNDYTRAVFERLAGPRRTLFERIRELQSGTAAIRFVQRAGGRFFFLETPADGTTARLMERAVNGQEKRLLLEPSRFDRGDNKASIDFFSVSPDGAHIAFVISHGGAEDWSYRILETATGKLLDDKVPLVVNPFPSWAADGQGFYYTRLQPLPPGAPETATYDNIRVYFHALRTDAARDRAVFGPGVVPGLELPAASAFPDVAASGDGRWLIATHVIGTDYNAPAMWVRDLHDDAAHWRKIADYADRVSAIQPHGDRLFVISGRRAPNGAVLSFDLDEETIADARVVVPAGEVIVSADNGWLTSARDALYIVGQRDGYGVIRRMPYADPDEIRTLALPAEGFIAEFTADPRTPGACFGLQSPVLSPRLYCHDPADNAIDDIGLREPDPADFSDIVVRHAEVPSTGGVRVPLTITGPRELKLDGKNPVLLTVYGAYGVIVPMWFKAQDLAWFERGGLIVFAHTRGGGEKGVAWHEAARKTGKQRTVDDTLAAARWLIEQGYTSPEHLAIAGKSAGGIPAGAAIVQRPDLFAAALIRVGVTDLLRIEKSAGGPANTHEYGSVRDEDEFHVLRAVSPYANVRDGVAYPAVLLETGANDPRVPPWQLAKMAARLQAATSSDRPVLLRVDYDTGHGLGTDKRQAAEQLADEYTFLGWQLGLPGFATDGN